MAISRVDDGAVRAVLTAELREKLPWAAAAYDSLNAAVTEPGPHNPSCLEVLEKFQSCFHKAIQEVEGKYAAARLLAGIETFLPIVANMGHPQSDNDQYLNIMTHLVSNVISLKVRCRDTMNKSAKLVAQEISVVLHRMLLDSVPHMIDAILMCRKFNHKGSALSTELLSIVKNLCDHSVFFCPNSIAYLRFCLLFRLYRRMVDPKMRMDVVNTAQQKLKAAPNVQTGIWELPGVAQVLPSNMFNNITSAFIVSDSFNFVAIREAFVANYSAKPVAPNLMRQIPIPNHTTWGPMRAASQDVQLVPFIKRPPIVVTLEDIEVIDLAADDAPMTQLALPAPPTPTDTSQVPLNLAVPAPVPAVPAAAAHVSAPAPVPAQSSSPVERVATSNSPHSAVPDSTTSHFISASSPCSSTSIDYDESSPTKRAVAKRRRTVTEFGEAGEPAVPLTEFGFKPLRPSDPVLGVEEEVGSLLKRTRHRGRQVDMLLTSDEESGGEAERSPISNFDFTFLYETSPPMRHLHDDDDGDDSLMTLPPASPNPPELQPEVPLPSADLRHSQSKKARKCKTGKTKHHVVTRVSPVGSRLPDQVLQENTTSFQECPSSSSSPPRPHKRRKRRCN